MDMMKIFGGSSGAPPVNGEAPPSGGLGGIFGMAAKLEAMMTAGTESARESTDLQHAILAELKAMNAVLTDISATLSRRDDGTRYEGA